MNFTEKGKVVMGAKEAIIGCLLGGFLFMGQVATAVTFDEFHPIAADWYYPKSEIIERTNLQIPDCCSVRVDGATLVDPQTHQQVSLSIGQTMGFLIKRRSSLLMFFAISISFGLSQMSYAQIKIIPEPQQLDLKSGTGFTINANTKIVINSEPNERDTFTANQLRRKVRDITG